MSHSLLQQILASYAPRGLSNCITFAPRNLSDERLAGYCVPVRIHGDNDSDVRRADRQGNAWEDQNTLAGASGVFLNGWLRRVRQRVVLRGEPGEGKTTALWLFAVELCGSLAAALRDEGPGPKSHTLGMPLVLPLNAWDGATNLIDAAIIHAARLCGLPGAEACLRACVDTRGCVLLLDGLDELPTRLTAELRLRLAYVAGPVVISSRYHVNPDEIVRTYDRAAMAPLSDWMVGDFIARYFADGEADTAGRLQALLRNVPSLRVMVRNPLLLAALCYSGADGGPARLPATRCGLLEAALRRMIRRAHGKRGERESTVIENAKLTALARIAWHAQQEQPEAVRREDLVPFLAAECADLFSAAGAKDADELVDGLLTDGVLVRPGEGPCRFLARPFHEFCVARHLHGLQADRRLTAATLPGPLAAWPDNRGKPAALIPLLAPGWTNIWPLVAGFGGPAEELISVMAEMWRRREDLVRSRLWMLSVALGEYCRRLNGSGPPEAAALARAVSEAVVECARQEEAASLGWWRIAAARLPPVPVVEAIRRASPQAEIASSLLRVLGEIGTDEAAEVLFEQVRTADGKGLSLSYPSQVYRALGFVGGARCKTVLRERLARGGGWAAYGCVQGLAQIGDPECITALADLARDPRTADQLRWHTIQQCERLGGPQVEAMVLEQMMPLVERISTTRAYMGGRHAEDAGHLEVCVEILGRIGTPHAARTLVGVLDQSMPENIRRIVCTAIAMCGDSQSREDLRRRIQDPGPHSQLSNWAALACVVAGDESCLGMLLEIGADAENCPDHLRVELVKAAGQSASPAAAEYLRDRLVGDTCETVRVIAAEALVGHPGTATVEALEGVLQRPDAPRGELLASYISLWQLGAGEREAARRTRVDPSGLDSAALKRLLRALGAARTPGGRAMVMAIRGRSDAAASECLNAMAEVQRREGYRPMPAGGWESPFAEHEGRPVDDTNFYRDDDQQFLDDLYGGMRLDHSHRKYWLTEIKFDFNRSGWGWIEEFSNQQAYAARLHQQFRAERRWDELRRHVVKLTRDWSHDPATLAHLTAIRERLEMMAAKSAPQPAPQQNPAAAEPVPPSDLPARPAPQPLVPAGQAHAAADRSDSVAPPSGGVIVVLATGWGPAYGGINSFNMDFCLALVRVSPGSRVICLTKGIDHLSSARLKSSNIHVLSLPHLGPGDTDPAAVAADAQELLTLEGVDRVGLVFGHDVITGRAAVELAKRMKGRSAVFHHMSYIRYQAVKKTGLSAFEMQARQRQVLEPADHVLAVGPLLRASAEEILPHRDVAMVVPGLAETPTRARGRARSFRAIAFGRMGGEDDPIKQGSLAVAGYGRFVARGDATRDWDRRFTMFGLPHEDYLREEQALKTLMAAEAGRQVVVNAMPYLENREALLGELAGHEVAFMLSWHEGFGLVGWEAIAAGVPLITSRQTGLFKLLNEDPGTLGADCVTVVDVLGSAGGQPDPRDVDAVAAALMDLSTNLDAAFAKAAKLRDWLKTKYSWEECGRTALAACGWDPAGRV